MIDNWENGGLVLSWLQLIRVTGSAGINYKDELVGKERWSLITAHVRKIFPAGPLSAFVYVSSINQDFRKGSCVTVIRFNTNILYLIIQKNRNYQKLIVIKIHFSVIWIFMFLFILYIYIFCLLQVTNDYSWIDCKVKYNRIF